MSEANQGRLLYIEESAWGSTPTGPPTLKLIRRTGGSFAQNPSHTASAEVRADRQIADQIRTDLAPAGTIDFELSYGAHDDLFEGVMMASAWTTAAATPGDATTVTIVAAAKTWTRSAGSYLTDGFFVGQVVEWRGWSTAGNNGYFRISALSATVMTTVEAPAADEGPTAMTTVSCKNDGTLRPGTTLNSFTFEEEYQDVTNSFWVYRGQVLGSMTLNIAPGSIITGTFGDMLGGVPIGATDPAVEKLTATVGDGSPTAAATNAILNAVDNVYDVREGGADSSMLISGLSLTFNNSLRAIAAVGSLGPADINLGTVQISGQISAYYGTNADAVIAKLLADTPSDHSFRVEDAAGNAYVFTVPRLKYTGGTPEMGGLDTDVPSNLAFVGYTDGTTAFQIDRFAA